MPSNGGARAADIRQLHAQIRRDIQNYEERHAQREKGLDGNDQRKEWRPAHDVKEQVGFGVKAIDRLLEELSRQTRPDEDGVDMRTAGEVAAMEYAKDDEGEADLLDEVTTLRTLASDDTSLETSSVADYSADPPAAPGFSTTSVVVIRDEIEASHRKMIESMETIATLLTQSQHWWTSPVVMRRLKTHSIRINYHARKVRKWGNQCRAHLFVSSSILNRTALEATADLRDVRSQLATYQKRRERLKHKRQHMHKIGDEIIRNGEEIALLHDKLALPVVQRASLCAQQEMGSDIPPPTLTVDAAEAVLLMCSLRSAFPQLSGSVETLLTYFADVGRV